MEKQIELNKEYLMLLQVTYVNYVSEGKKKYEISSKIVKKEDYLKDKDCIGEIQGEYCKTVRVYTPYTAVLKKHNKAILKKKVSRVINRFYLRSKRLVEEWELTKEVMKELDFTLNR